MHTEKYEYKGNAYTITIRDPNVGSFGAPPSWRLEVVDKQNRGIANLTLSYELSNYIKDTFGKDHIELLASFAKSEIQRLAK